MINPKQGHTYLYKKYCRKGYNLRLIINPENSLGQYTAQHTLFHSTTSNSGPIISASLSLTPSGGGLTTLIIPEEADIDYIRQVLKDTYEPLPDLRTTKNITILIWTEELPFDDTSHKTVTKVKTDSMINKQFKFKEFLNEYLMLASKCLDYVVSLFINYERIVVFLSIVIMGLIIFSSIELTTNIFDAAFMTVVAISELLLFLLLVVLGLLALLFFCYTFISIGRYIGTQLKAWFDQN